MTISSLLTKGLASSAITPIGFGGAFQRDPYAPNYEILVHGGKGAIPFVIDESITRFISSIEFEDNADQFDKLTITLEAQIDDFGGGDINSIIDSRLFTEGHILEFRAGFGNSLFTVGAADIVAIEPDFPESGPPTLQIIGYDLLHRASRRKPRKGVSYSNSRDSQIASIIGERNGFDIATSDPSTFAGIRKVAGVNNRVQKKGVSDYEFLKKIADINGFDLFSKFDPSRGKFSLFFQPPPTKNSKEVFTFAYNQGDLAFQHKLLSFTPKLDAHDQGTDFEVFVLKDKEASSTTFKPTETLQAGESKQLTSATERRFTGGNINNQGKKTPNSDGIEVAFKAYGRSFKFLPHKRFKDEKQAKRAIEEFIKRQKENFITGDGKLIGNEVLQSRQIHNLVGISEQFEGKYYLTKVVHTITKGEGYFTTFSARKVIADTLVKSPPTLNLTDNDKRFRSKRLG